VLAGYLAHEINETVLFIVLDSLEAIDSSRIAALVEYFADYAPISWSPSSRRTRRLSTRTVPESRWGE